MTAFRPAGSLMMRRGLNPPCDQIETRVADENYSIPLVVTVRKAMGNQDINYEKMPADMAMDETDVNLRSYFSRQTDQRLQEYNPDWSDEEVMKWDDNFTSDGTLFITCSEREVEIDEYRRVMEEHMKFRGLWPPKPTQS